MKLELRKRQRAESGDPYTEVRGDSEEDRKLIQLHRPESWTWPPEWPETPDHDLSRVASLSIVDKDSDRTSSALIEKEGRNSSLDIVQRATSSSSIRTSGDSGHTKHSSIHDHSPLVKPLIVTAEPTSGVRGVPVRLVPSRDRERGRRQELRVRRERLRDAGLSSTGSPRQSSPSPKVDVPSEQNTRKARGGTSHLSATARVDTGRRDSRQKV